MTKTNFTPNNQLLSNRFSDTSDLHLVCGGILFWRQKMVVYERTDVSSAHTVKDLMDKFNLPQTTAYAVKKRGYIAKKTRNIDYDAESVAQFDVDMAYRAAGVVFWKMFYPMLGNALDHYDDMKQMAVLKMVEISKKIGRSTNQFSTMCAVAKFEMYNYMQLVNLRGAFAGKMTSFEKNLEGNGLYAIA